MMKKIIYNVTSGKVKVEETENTTPYLIYKECNNSIVLEVVVPQNKERHVLESLKGNLPDDVLMALGIAAEGEDLTELCAELRSLGYPCQVTIEENGDYCEILEAQLEKSSKSGGSEEMVKIVYEKGSLRIKRTRAESPYFLYEEEGNDTRVEVVIEKSKLDKVYELGSSPKALFSLVFPECSVNLENPPEVLRCLEDIGEYSAQVTRSEGFYQLYVER